MELVYDLLIFQSTTNYYYSRNLNMVPAHVKPVPVNPALHAHTKDPGVLSHVALPSQ